MADTPKKALKAQKQAVRGHVENEEISEELGNALLEWADAVNPNSQRVTHNDDDSYSVGTTATYLRGLRLCAIRGNMDLTETTAEEFNDLMANMDEGINEHVPDDGLNKATLKRYQSAAKSFYRHFDFGINSEDIQMYVYSSPPRHDERDLFTIDEVEALRNAAQNPRDRAILELLIHTGQRITAIQTLRIKDVDVSEGYIYLNDTVDGLKGAAKRGKRRPILGARKYLRDWLDYHPRGNEPEAPLFVGDPDHHKTDLSQPLHTQTIRYNLTKMAERAEVSKPVNPHAFRHYWVTIMKRDYNLDSDTVKMLMGATKDSTVMETTYSHVTSEDFIEKVEVAAGYREKEENNPLTPQACPVCGELLQDDWKACPSCGELFSAEAEQMKKEVDESMWEDKGKVEPESRESEAVDDLRKLLKENPEVVKDLLSES